MRDKREHTAMRQVAQCWALRSVWLLHHCCVRCSWGQHLLCFRSGLPDSHCGYAHAQLAHVALLVQGWVHCSLLSLSSNAETQ
jgi:hypothetical protein